jgi:penicillin-binding protein 2
MGYDVIVDRAFFPDDNEASQQNNIILELIRLFEQQGEEWNDSLPISRRAPFSFEVGYDDEIARLKKMIDAQEYATADNAMYWLIDRYELEDYSAAEARMIAGVRYTMEQRGFNLRNPYTFASDVSISTVVQVKERSYEFLGVDVEESASRYNPVGDVAPHMIGSIGPIYAEEYEELKAKGYALNDMVGKSGIESALESYLRGTDGKREIISDSYNNTIEANESVPPIPGNTVRLTLNSTLQRIAQESLEAQILYLNETAPAGEGKESDTGAAVVVEVKTGKILAAATYPTYDLTTYRKDYQLLSQDPLSPLVNRALTGQYAPGSTFKPTVGLTGLREHIIDDGSTVTCGHVYNYFNHRFTCLGSHGATNLLGALRVSCNIFFYDVGRRVEIDAIDRTAQQLGLGEATGIELREAVGHRSNPETKLAVQGEEWYPGDTLQSSIGQLLHLYTPLQLANYAATIANRGTRMKLTLVDEILDYAQNTVIQPFSPQVAEVLEDTPLEAFESVIRGMVAASTGTANGTFGGYPITVASKTGTPETEELPNSVFIAFAPAEDPEIAICVVIEKGWHGYTGAPVAKALFDEYFGVEHTSPLQNGPQRLKEQRAAIAAGEMPETSENAEETSTESDGV